MLKKKIKKQSIRFFQVQKRILMMKKEQFMQLEEKVRV
jgi:hypothetical protein